MPIRTIETIELKWDGPLNTEQLKELTSEIDYGIYQVYGTHNVLGDNTLLYIGIACDQPFSVRFAQHAEWFQHEISDLQIYVGRVGGAAQPPNDQEWTNSIKTAERLLIYFCSPPYNSQHLNGYGTLTDKVVLNFGKKNRIPFEVSTLFLDSEYRRFSERWKPFRDLALVK